jgi:hypothetical protein
MSEAIGGEAILALNLYPYPESLNLSCRRMRMPILVAITNHRFIRFVYLCLSGHKGYELPVSFRLTRLGLGCDLTTPRLAIAVRLLI